MKTTLLSDGETLHSTDYVDYDASIKLTLIFSAIILYIIIRVWWSIRNDKKRKSN